MPWDDGDVEVRLSLRLSARLAAQMRHLAAVHDRSLNGEIVRAVRAYVEARTHQDQDQDQDGEQS